MRLGVIDIGSNTVHMLVVDAHHGARPLPAVTHKIALRLSEHLADGRVGDAAVQTLTAFLDEARELADEHGVEEVLAPRFIAPGFTECSSACSENSTMPNTVVLVRSWLSML